MRILLVLLLSFVTVAHAEDRGLLPGLIAEPMLLPVRISGKDITLDSYVVRPDRPGRFPLVIMTHGTPGGWDDAFFRNIARRTPTNFNTAAVALAQRGYATLSVMRCGFGLSGGGYSEALLRPCDYLAAVRVAADDIVVAIAAARREPWVDPDRDLGVELHGANLAAEHRPRLALGVASPGADHAFLAAELVAFLGRGIERARYLRRHGVAMGAAGIGHVDRERGTGALHGHSRAVALALLQRGGTGSRFRRVIIGLAVGAAFADRECAGPPSLTHKAVRNETRGTEQQCQDKNEQRAALRGGG
jgi:hypothetical protein